MSIRTSYRDCVNAAENERNVSQFATLIFCMIDCVGLRVVFFVFNEDVKRSFFLYNNIFWCLYVFNIIAQRAMMLKDLFLSPNKKIMMLKSRNAST